MVEAFEILSDDNMFEKAHYLQTGRLDFQNKRIEH